ncbi:hypothetical protein tb265_18660 [Gemmatimonadetes bacterium T265]|nr:hypothetical protein tb265_18660 [Gemmatimonadetes bacterium T265]
MPRLLRRSPRPRLARHCLAAVAALAVPALAAPALVAAQVGTTTDVLTGTVRDPAGKPVANATVTATSVETQVSRNRQTDAKGRYVIVFPEGGGRYQVSVRSIGLAPRTLLVQRQVDEDQLIANVTLGAPGAAGAPTLDRVVVRGQRTPRGGNDRPSPGSTERLLTPDQVFRLPIEDQSDLTALAALAPGVVSIAGTDSTANSFSVAGQRTDQNNVTLDGLTFGSSSVPQDAVRNTRVITSTFDVARGQFSGGQIASTTRSGTNLLQGSFTEQYRNPSLSWAPAGAGAFGQGYLQNSFSGGVGGPLVKDRLFFFGAFQLRERYDPIQSLTTANATTLQRLGVSPDSVTRFLGGLSQYGVASTLAGIPSRRTTDGDQLFARLDAVLSQGETLTLRLDTRRTTADATRISALGLPSAGGTQHQTGGGVFASLTSQLTATDGPFAGALINEVRAYRSLGDQATDAYLDAPAGRVQILSALPAAAGGATGVGATVLQFGGNASLPQASTTTGFEGTEELSFIPAGRPHRVKLGALLNLSHLDQTTATNSYGTYTFASLADFLAARPSQFTRTLTPTERLGGSVNAALYAGDTWRAAPGVQLTYGLRLEHSDYTHAPAPNTTLDSAFGVRTGRFPAETHFSPRVGFTWAPTSAPAPNAAPNDTAATTRGGPPPDGGGRGSGGGGFGGRGGGGFAGGFGNGRSGGPTTVVRGGVGEFRGLAPAGLFAAAQGAPGFLATQSQLVCTGADVPTPDYGDWTTDPAAIPSSCLAVPTEGVGLGAATGAARPNAVVIGQNFQAPRSWRASLGVQRRVGERTALSLDGNWALGVAQYGFRDLNLNTAPQFTLANEGNRPVYVPASTIVPATGALSLFNSRVDPAFGRVLLAESGLRSSTQQATVGLNTSTARGLLLSATYTFTHSRDQSSFPGALGGAGVAGTTPGNPNLVQWATSDLQRAHQFITTLTYPVTPTVELTSIARLSSGAPFTPLVGNDVNGDGARDDQAFVFDPAATGDTAVAAGMRRVLAAVPAGVRRCLTSQLGAVAARNSCTGPWTPSLDFQANIRPTVFGLDRRLSLSLSTTNFLAGLDQLIHGGSNVQGWGNPARPDATLLTVRGFDPATRQFLYTVNERFGQTNAGANAFRVPFSLGLQARLAIGPDPARDRLRQVFGDPRARGADAAAAFGERFARLVPNPVDTILALRDTLALSPAQVTALTGLRDSLRARNAPVADSLRVRLAAAQSAPDPRQAFATVAPLLQQARANAAATLEAAKAVLTPEQWARVPESVKRPPRGGLGGGRGAGRPGGPPP